MSNFYKFITSNASLWTGAGSLKSKYSATTIYQIRSVWYETTGTTPTAKFTAGETQPDETQPDNKSYINVYLVLNVNQSSPTTCELHKIRFEFSNPVATVDDITSWTKDWPTTLTGSWTDINVGWNVSTKTVIDTDYAYNTSIITLGTETAKYYGYRVNYPARNFADFVSTSASIRGYAGSYHERMDPIYSIGTITHLDYNRIDATNDSPLFRSAVAGDSDPIYTTRIFHSNWGSNASFVYIRVAATTRNVNTRFGFKEKAPTYMNTVDWSTGDILNSVKWPTDISYSLNNNASPVENSWTQTSAQRQAWAYSLDTGTVANNVINNGGLIGGISYNTVYLTEYSTAYVPPSFNTTTASSAAKLSELTNILSGTPLEIYNVWYTTAQAEGSETTTCWVYYAYKDAQSVVHYSTQEVSYNNITNAWTLSAGVYEATKTSSVFDPTPTTYTALYVGMSPFDIDVSPTSLASLKTVYDASLYPSSDLSLVYNIWYDTRDAFDTDVANTSREVASWIYVLRTDRSYESRKVSYTVDNNSYNWTITTDISSANPASEISVGLIELTEFDQLAYFRLNKYLLSTATQISNIQTIYNITSTDASLSAVNEIWYKTQTIGDETTNHDDVSIIEIGDISYDYIEMQIYYKTETYGQLETTYGTGSSSVNYYKTSRGWDNLDTYTETTGVVSGINDGLSTQGYKQIYYNIYLDPSNNQTPKIKETYTASHSPLEIDNITKLWTEDTTSSSNIMNIFIGFTLKDNPNIQKYTLGQYDRVINSWSITDASMAMDVNYAQTLFYGSFTILDLENATDQIKAAYKTNTNTMLNIYRVWYDQLTIEEDVISLRVFYSYQTTVSSLTTYFAEGGFSFTQSKSKWLYVENTENSVEYNYNGGTLNPEQFIKIDSYDDTPEFIISLESTSSDAIIDVNSASNTITRFQTALGNTVNRIHGIWATTTPAVITPISIIYGSPQVSVWVYYSESISSYKSRNVVYNLQTNEWEPTQNDTVNTATVRSSGLSEADLTNYIQIYTNPPAIPPFPQNIAKTEESLTVLKTEYNNNSTKTGGKTAVNILELWYHIPTQTDEIVNCIAYISDISNNQSGFSAFDVSYNTTTTNISWNFSTSNKYAVISDKSTIFTNLDALSSEYMSFYTLPEGTSVLGSGIRYYDNSYQTTAMPPIGTIIIWPYLTLPTNYIWCDGKPYTRTQDNNKYEKLFNIIGNIYGGTNPSFNVPNLRTRFPLGYSSDISSTNDQNYVSANRQGGNSTINKNQFVHTHKVETNTLATGIDRQPNVQIGHDEFYWDNGPWIPVPRYSFVSGNTPQYDQANTYPSDSTVFTHNYNSSSGEFYPEFMALQYIIKYK